MGYFAGIVPLRSQVEPERSFSAGLRALHQTTVDCFANAMPFAELARALGDAGAPGHNPIFEVRFALQNHPVPDVVAAADLGETADALDWHRPLSPRLRNHGDRSRTSKLCGCSGRIYFRSPASLN